MVTTATTRSSLTHTIPSLPIVSSSHSFPPPTARSQMDLRMESVCPPLNSDMTKQQKKRARSTLESNNNAGIKSIVNNDSDKDDDTTATTAQGHSSRAAQRRRSFLSGVDLAGVDILSIPDPPSPGAVAVDNGRGKKLNMTNQDRCKNNNAIHNNNPTSTNLSDAHGDNTVEHMRKVVNSHSRMSPSIRIQSQKTNDSNIQQQQLFPKQEKARTKRKSRHSMLLQLPMTPTADTAIQSWNHHHQQQQAALQSKQAIQPQPINMNPTIVQQRQQQQQLLNTPTARMGFKSLPSFGVTPLLDECSPLKRHHSDIMAFDTSSTLSFGNSPIAESKKFPFAKVEPEGSNPRTQSQTSVMSVATSVFRSSNASSPEDNNAQMKAKRRKKRLSMYLPDVSRSADEGKHPANESKREPIHKVTTEEMDSIRSLVRSYCAVPQTDRPKSSQAFEIERLSNYPLTRQEDFLTAELRAQKDSRRQLLMKLAPLVDSIESKKQEESRQVEQWTGCRVEKVGSGNYRYLDKATGLPIGNDDYQRRYMHSLEERKRQRNKECLPGAIKPTHPPSPPVPSSRSSPVNVKKMKDTDLVRSPHKPTSEPLEGEARRVSDDEHVGSPSTKEKPTARHTQRKRPKTDISIRLPSRHEQSEDPLEAASEKKLWAAIDKALGEYSREIIAIRMQQQQQAEDNK